VVVVVVVVAVTDMFCNTHNRLLMQFHITGKCNLRCKHCYRTEGDVEPLTFDDVVAVVEQYKVLLNRYNKLHNIKRRGHINITGGEPFIRIDIGQIIEYLGNNRELFSYGILSNGSFIDDEMIKLLKETEVSFVQLSIDGNRNTHDVLRKEGDYDRVFAVAKKLEKNKVRTYISFTANKENYKYIPKVAWECRKRGITKLWSDRIVPIGSGEDLEKLAMTAEVLPDYLKVLKKAQGGFLSRLFFPKTQVTMNRALQFLEGGNMYSCSAGQSLITVDEFGNIMPCRRMPIICGNVFENTLETVYFESEVFIRLRNKAVPKECEKCIYRQFCLGGAKCQSYAMYKDFCHADPGCCLTKRICGK